MKLDRLGINMNFTFETQGAITYLVCELAPTDQLDSLTLGMLVFILLSELWPRLSQSKFKKERNLGIGLGVIIMLISLII